MAVHAHPGTPRPVKTVVGPGVMVDHYEVIRPIGAGGMGEVFLARDTKLGRLVALKVLFSATSEVAARILVEARATAKCRHENIVVIHDMNEFQGLPYLVLEYLEGRSLRKLHNDEPLPPWRSLEIMAQVLKALEHAHDAGIIHRDLKPDNIFVTSTGAVKVLDFGIAKLHGMPSIEGGIGNFQGHELDQTYMTVSGSGVVGTFTYMAPEQFRSDAGVDHRVDLWAFGIIMYKLATGVHPYEGLEMPGLMFQIGNLEEPVRSVLEHDPRIDATLAAIIDRLLRKKREERFPTARAVLDALEAVMPRNAAAAYDDRCPFPGLQSFQEGDADRFFGRAAQITRAIGRLEAQPLLAIVGPSGVGKSSFVRAGLVPTLKRERAWEAITIRPGRTPLASLASAIQHVSARTDTGFARAATTQLFGEPGYLGAVLRWRASVAGCRILLFVDQFEELYTLVADANQRALFVAALQAAADDPSSPVRVVISLRSDFLDRAAESRPFMEAITDGLHYLMPLGRDGLHDALVRPVQQAGHNFESHALVEQMIEEVAATPGALPLLQFAAARMWESRDRARRVMTHASYVAIGGVAGTLASHADTVLAGLPWERRALARSLFQRLVTADGTRAIVDLAELVALDQREVPALVDHLVTSRLLVSNTDDRAGATVEIVHESLISAWPQLHQWMEAGRDEATFMGQLRQAAQQWDARGRDPGMLWRGDMADEARRFAQRIGNALAPRESDFLKAVLAAATRSSRMKRIALLTTLALLSALVVVAIVVVIRVRKAEAVARDEAAAAEIARGEVAEQLRLVQQKEAERIEAERLAAAAAASAASAEADASMSREELQKSNAKLKDALAAANTAVVREQAARKQLEELLATEKKRTKDLLAKRKKIATELQ